MKVQTKPWSERLEALQVKSKENPKKEPKKEREKLGSFRKLVGKVADLDFITAPHLVPSDKEEEQVINPQLI